jgi:glycosyltransferase involved in cell wall biosynthesis
VRVLQLIPAYKPGGAERSALEIGQALVAAGHTAQVLADDGPWRARFLSAGIDARVLPVGAKGPRWLSAWARLPGLLADLAPDLIHVRSRLPAWLLQLRRAAVGARPVVATLHGLHSVSRYSAVMLKADALIAVSDTARVYWQTHYPDLDASRLRVIPRGIDLAAWPSRWADTPRDPARPTLLLPGRATRLKGHVEALDLLAALRAAGVPARLYCPGAVEPGREGYTAELRRLAAARGLAESVDFRTSSDQLAAEYARADVVLQLSNRPESFGRTVVEALAVGVPVVGWAHGGVGELLARVQPDGAVPLGDRTALQRCVQAALQRPFPIDRRALPTLAQMQAATLALYRELLDG